MSMISSLLLTEIKNHGNFLSFLDFRAQAGEEVLANHLRKKWIIHVVFDPNDLNQLFGENLTKKSYLKSQTQHLIFLLIIAEEADDVSNQEIFQFIYVLHDKW